MSIYDFAVKDAQGREHTLSEKKGKVLLIVNTASKCGFTPQYEELQNLYTQYKDQGLEILAFPCDQFAHQEPGTDAEIQQFCQVNYGVSFPVYAKINVNGRNAAPLYKYLRQQKSAPLGSLIKWNFTKFLVDREGNVVERYAPNEKPADLAPAIENLLESSPRE